MHERKPGHLANLTLLRYQELLERSTGREARTGTRMPFPQWDEPISVRFTWFATRHRSLAPKRPGNADHPYSDRLFGIQRCAASIGCSDPAPKGPIDLLELVNPSEERSYFRQELKAVQSEHIAELQLQRNPWAPRRLWWGTGGKGRGAGKGDTDPEAAPFNMGDEEQKGNKKGNKGGKGGKHRGWKK